MALLHLIRYKNLLLIIIVQLLIHYALFLPFEVDAVLNNFGISLLVLATICIAAAGNIINDINDVETDLINKPNKVIVGKSITENKAYTWFILFNIIGIAIGFYLSLRVGKNQFFAIFVITSLLLYLYATTLKHYAIIGNLLVSGLVALSILVVPIFDLLPVMTVENQQAQLTFFKIVVDYALFALVINFVREVVKDIEDVDGDHKAGMQTLPILLGRDRAKHIAFFLSLLPIAGVIYYLSNYLYQQQILVAYFLVFVIAPLIYCSIKLFSAKRKEAFRRISLFYKIIMLMGLLSILLYPFVLR